MKRIEEISPRARPAGAGNRPPGIQRPMERRPHPRRRLLRAPSEHPPGLKRNLDCILPHWVTHPGRYDGYPGASSSSASAGVLAHAAELAGGEPTAIDTPSRRSSLATARGSSPDAPARSQSPESDIEPEFRIRLPAWVTRNGPYRERDDLFYRPGDECPPLFPHHMERVEIERAMR